MAQQTAVEWFAGMITELIHEAYHSELADLFEQAKYMEKQKIIDFANNYLDDDSDMNAEQYYTEIYGK
jgi:hypothetical protein